MLNIQRLDYLFRAQPSVSLRYLIFTAFMTAFIYPTVGAMTWGYGILHDFGPRSVPARAALDRANLTGLANLRFRSPPEIDQHFGDQLHFVERFL